jgi:uncharacterized protein (TIGR03067 family)
MNPRVLLVVVVLLPIPTGACRGENDADDLVRDRKLIQGAWAVVAYDQDGKSLPAEIVQKMSVVIQQDTITIKPRVLAQRIVTLKDGKRQVDVKFTLEEGKSDEAKYRLETAKKRKVLALIQDPGRGQSTTVQGAYALEGDRLTIWLPLPDRKLPKQLPEAPTAGLVRLVLKKAMP